MICRHEDHVFFVDLDDAIQLENFTVEGFYQELSVQVLRIRMGEGEFRAHIEDTYASKKTVLFLIDEMQCAIQSSNVERAVRGFCRFLDKNSIPWIGIGTSRWSRGRRICSTSSFKKEGPSSSARKILESRIETSEAILYLVYQSGTISCVTTTITPLDTQHISENQILHLPRRQRRQPLSSQGASVSAV